MRKLWLVPFCLIIQSAAWGHGLAGCGDCGSDPSVQLFIKATHLRGLTIKKDVTLKPEFEHYAEMNGVKYSISPAIFQLITQVIDAAAGLQDGLGNPHPLHHAIKEWAEGLQKQQTYFQLGGAIGELANRIGLPLAILWGVAEFFEPAHGPGCIILLATATGVGVTSRFAFASLFSSPMVSATTHQRLMMAVQNASYSAKYWWKMGRLFRKVEGELKKTSKWDLNRKLPESAAGVEHLVADSDLYAIIATRRLQPNPVHGPPPADGYGKIAPLDFMPSTSLRRFNLRDLPVLTGEDIPSAFIQDPIADFVADVTFKAAIDKRVASLAELEDGLPSETPLFNAAYARLSDRTKSETERFLAIRELTALMRLKHKAFRAAIWELYDKQGHNKWWSFERVLFKQAAAIDQLETLLKLIAFEKKEPSNGLIELRRRKLKKVHDDIHSIYDDITRPLSESLAAAREPEPSLVGQISTRVVQLFKKLSGFTVEEKEPTVIDELHARSIKAEEELVGLRRTADEGWLRGDAPPPKLRERAVNMCKAVFGAVRTSFATLF